MLVILCAKLLEEGPFELENGKGIMFLKEDGFEIVVVNRCSFGRAIILYIHKVSRKKGDKKTCASSSE